MSDNNRSSTANIALELLCLAIYKGFEFSYKLLDLLLILYALDPVLAIL